MLEGFNLDTRDPVNTNDQDSSTLSRIYGLCWVIYTTLHFQSIKYSQVGFLLTFPYNAPTLTTN